MFSAAAKPILATGLTDSKPLTESVDVQGRTSDIAVLTRRLAAQDELAFREFHRAYFDRLYRFQLVVARGREQEARDALQETLLRVIRYVRVFESEEAFWDWLKVLARSAARDAGRKQQRYIALLERFRLIQTERESRVEADMPESMGSVLEEVLARLSDEDRRLLVGKYLEGATVQELSIESGLTLKAVESRLHRLRREVRERILRVLRAL